MLNWSSQFNIFCFLDNQQYGLPPQRYECLAGVGALHVITSENVKDLEAFLARHPGWKFGHLSYELTHGLRFSPKKDGIGFPRLGFFVPRTVLLVEKDRLTILADDPERVYRDIMSQAPAQEQPPSSLRLQARLTRDQYLEKIRSLQAHILRGDCYEINFCQEHYSEEAFIEPLRIFEKLMEVSPNPFSALYRLEDQYLICASPERFLRKNKEALVSQPIKGTIGRDPADPVADRELAHALRNSQKDQSENVMVVDLVRNDLARICREASVKVEELFGIYSFPQVHQMISTVSGRLKEGTGFSRILEATFPMGSMTGAPKHRVMELIDAYEERARGIFSGSVGYVSPEGDFDFNVVIRSIMYNARDHYLSYQVGSGITFYSEPEKEWEECLLKAAAIKKVLEPPPCHKP